MDGSRFLRHPAAGSDAERDSWGVAVNFLTAIDAFNGSEPPGSVAILPRENTEEKHHPVEDRIVSLELAGEALTMS